MASVGAFCLNVLRRERERERVYSKRSNFAPLERILSFYRVFLFFY